MARNPRAVWRELPENRTQGRITPTQLIFHSAVTKADSLYGYFKRDDVKVESHFYMQGDGDLEQYIDTATRADANYKASVRAVSVETWDNGNPDEVRWTAAQMDRLVDLAVWAHRTHGIPLVRAPRWDAPGMGGHSDYPGEWTNVRGKTCPGMARRPQVAEIITRAKMAVNGNKPEPSKPIPPKPAPQPAPSGDLPMPPTLREGDRGVPVRRLQALLVAVHHNLDAEGGIDGVFGPGLKREVIAFQKARGLGADGIVGDNTWRRLILG